MVNKSVEKAIASFLLIGVPFATLFLVTDTVTDPVNVTKLFAAGCVGFGVFSIALIYGAKAMWQTSRIFVVAAVLFVLGMFSAVAASAAPIAQNLYGVYGRQTGLICYLILTVTSLATLLLRRQKSFEYIIYALLFAGSVNVLYCGWALIFGDFIGWSNPYGNILGLFGNPDFISAFLGMFIAGVVGYAFSSHHSWMYRFAFLVLAVIALVETKKSHAIQGLVVTGAGLAIVGFYLVRSKFNNAITWLYVSIIAIIGGFALAGALQKGPLASIIYKTSVSLRGQYWKAGIKMGTDHPLTGVGMDGIGNWYRRTRSEYAATVLPGPNTIVNASHNVIIDIFADGGFPLLISYLALIAVGVWAVIKVTLRQRKYDGIFVAMVATWAGYTLQSIVSINQIGLAIWGWVLAGALIAYEYSTRDSSAVEAEPSTGKGRQVKKAKSEHAFSPQLVGGIGVVIGGLIACPPMAADSKWRSALNSKNVQQVEAALTPSYLTPPDSNRLAQATLLFENSKMHDKAYAFAKRAIEFNPDYYDAWRVLYSLTNSTQEDKDLAFKNLKRLDPYNPNVLGQ